MASIERREGESFDAYKERRKAVALRERYLKNTPATCLVEQTNDLHVTFVNSKKKKKKRATPDPPRHKAPKEGKRHRGESLKGFAKRRRDANKRKRTRRKGGL